MKAIAAALAVILMASPAVARNDLCADPNAPMVVLYFCLDSEAAVRDLRRSSKERAKVSEGHVRLTPHARPVQPQVRAFPPTSMETLRPFDGETWDAGRW